MDLNFTYQISLLVIDEAYHVSQWEHDFRPSYLNITNVMIRPQKAFMKQRCLVPVTAFFEWEKCANKKVKYRIQISREKIFSLTGIFDTFPTNNGKWIDYFTIITTFPNEQLLEIHDQMPVIIERKNEKYWFNNSFKDNDYLKRLTEPYSGKLIVEPEEKHY